jgi:predicted nucleotidyltransferase component of viral defense system
MKLHSYPEVFNDLIILTSKKLNISEDYVRRDYFIVLVLKRLGESEFMDNCIFKGGTSLSKCYPGSIQRFSEDVDLTN